MTFQKIIGGFQNLNSHIDDRSNLKYCKIYRTIFLRNISYQLLEYTWKVLPFFILQLHWLEVVVRRRRQFVLVIVFVIVDSFFPLDAAVAQVQSEAVAAKYSRADQDEEGSDREETPGEKIIFRHWFAALVLFWFSFALVCWWWCCSFDAAAAIAAAAAAQRRLSLWFMALGLLWRRQQALLREREREREREKESEIESLVVSLDIAVSPDISVSHISLYQQLVRYWFGPGG
jgi:hypothetical protein